MLNRTNSSQVLKSIANDSNQAVLGEHGLDALLWSAWGEILRAAPDRQAELTALFEQNPLRYDIRTLEALLGIAQKRRLAVALRGAGLRRGNSGPMPGFGVLRSKGIWYVPAELWSIRGAVAAWRVARISGLSAVPSYRIAEALLKSDLTRS